MQFDQTPDQRQTNAQAALRPIHRGVDLGKQIEDMAQLLRGNADAVVAHMNQYVRPIELDTHIDPTLCVGVLGGIREQVLHHLRQTNTVGIDRHRLGRQMNTQLLMLALDRCLQRIDRILHHVAQQHALASQLDLALRDA